MSYPQNRLCGALSILLAPLRRPAPRNFAALGYSWLPFTSTSFVNLYAINKNSIAGSLCILLSPLQRSVCLAGRSVCLCPLRFGLRVLGFDINQFVRTDIWNLPLRCVQITPLVLYQIFWYNTKGGWYHTKGIWFFRFCDFG